MLNDNKLKRMKEILTKPGVGVGVGAGDALCAKLIERAGFDFICHERRRKEIPRVTCS